MTLGVAEIFTHHMVVQIDKPLTIWGTGQESSTVRIDLAGYTTVTKVKEGQWCATLPPPSFNSPQVMTVSDGRSQIQIEDIVAGEVWLAGGQSNMEFSLEMSDGGVEESLQANDRGIRFFHVPKRAVPGEELTGNQKNWETCHKESSARISAVAWYFAKKIRAETGRPVGIIGCNWGGTSITCWIPEAVLEREPAATVYLDEFRRNTEGVTEDEYQQLKQAYQLRVNTFNQNVRDWKEAHPGTGAREIKEALGNYPWPPPEGPGSYRRPGGLFESMVTTVIPYSLRGVIYYQGEEDVKRPQTYLQLMNTLKQSWREAWNQPELPFFITQLTVFLPDEPEADWPRLREAQSDSIREDPASAMVVTVDCGEADDIHPIRKRPVGERLGDLAVHRVYRGEDRYGSPEYMGWKAEGNRACVQISHAESGLWFTGKSLKGFELCGPDSIYWPAEGIVKGSSVVLVSKQVAEPAGVRYGWANCMEMNLYNRDNHPVGPFRSERD